MTKRYTLAVLATLFLAACAGMPHPQSATEVDLDYVHAVEKRAADARVDVEWINPPRRKVESEDQG